MVCVSFLGSSQMEVTSKTSNVEGAVTREPYHHLTDAQPTTLSTGSTWVLSIFTECGLGSRLCSCQGDIITVKGRRLGWLHDTVQHADSGSSAPLRRSTEKRDDDVSLCDSVDYMSVIQHKLDHTVLAGKIWFNSCPFVGLEEQKWLHLFLKSSTPSEELLLSGQLIIFHRW